MEKKWQACVRMASGGERSAWFSSVWCHNYEVDNDASGRPTKYSSVGRYFPQVRAHDGVRNCPFVALGAHLRPHTRTTTSTWPDSRRDNTVERAVRNPDPASTYNWGRCIIRVLLVVWYARAKIRAPHETSSHLNAVLKVTRESTSVVLTPFKIRAESISWKLTP